MKSLLIALTICATFLTTVLPSFSQTASPSDAAWAGYFRSLKTAVTKHDKSALKALIASRIEYEDGTVSGTRFIEDFGSEGGRLLKALNTGLSLAAAPSDFSNPRRGRLNSSLQKGNGI